MHPEPQQGSNISSPQGLCSLPVTPGAQIQSTTLKQPQTGPCHPAPCWGNDGRGLPAMPENTLNTGSPLPPQGCKQSPSPEGSFWTRVSPALPAEVQPTHRGLGRAGKLSPAPGAHAMQPPASCKPTAPALRHTPGAGSQRCNAREVW